MAAVAAPGRLGKLRGELRIPRTTPKIIELVAIAGTLLAVVTFLTAYAAISRTENAVLSIGATAKPSVVVAEKLSVALADMDAAITNSSLGSRKSWWRYVGDADTAVAMAIEASRHLGGGNGAEAESLRRVLARLRTYYQFVGGANAVGTEAGADPKLPLTMTLWASHGLRQDVIPEVEQIARGANATLEAAYAEYDGGAGSAIIYAIVPATLLLLLLLGAQIFLARRTHRLINIPMAIGTGLLTLFMAWFLYLSLSDQQMMAAAKEDSFSTILHLYRAKVASYLMKADESMWLFEQRKVRSDYAQSFADGSKAILNIGNAYELALGDQDHPAAPVDQAAIERLRSDLTEAQLRANAGRWDEAGRLTRADIPGYLGEELAHVRRHPGERKSATDAVTFFLRNIDIDTRIRTLEAAGHHAEAVRLGIGENEGGSNWAFQGMNGAIDEIIKLNDAEFQSDMLTIGNHVLRLVQALAGALVGAALLAGVGLWQRYAEYR